MGGQFTNAQRREIIMYHASAPGPISNRSLTLWANEKFSTSVSEMTISRLLKNKALYLGRVTDKPNSMRACKVLSPAVERATFAWFSLMEEKSTTISDDVLCSIAKRFYARLPRAPGSKEHHFSKGWVAGFKKRHGIKGFVRHGEAASADNAEETKVRIQEIKDKIATYNPSDVFNMDETGLFYRLEPNRTLATKRLSGKKLQKERITIALTTNVDGSTKLPPFVIHKYARPRAFTRRNISNPDNLHILWNSNSKTWMTTILFQKFLLDFERRMRLAGKDKALLLVDNFSGHQYNTIESQLHIVTVEFLPPNTTSYLQPMDAGVINSFKAQYRKILIEHRLDCFMNNEDPEIDVYQSVKMLECAWRVKVTSSAIYHCWRHTGLLILPDLNVRTTWSHAEELQELTTLLEKLSLITGDIQVSNMEAGEYVAYEFDFDLNNSMEITEDEVWDVIGRDDLNSPNLDEEGEEQIEVKPIVKFSEVQSCVLTLQTYMEQRSNDTTKSPSMLLEIEKHLKIVNASESVQRTIDSFFVS